MQIAATNLQLYSQLADNGWPADSIEAVHRAYAFVARFSYSSFRANWKPFLAHLTGVASIVAWDTADSVRVAAALSHSALEFGRFPVLVKLSEARKEACLREHLGDAVFELVKAYHTADWKLVMDPNREPSPVEAALRHIKLADMLDDLTDELSPVATRKKVAVSLDDANALRRCADMARGLDARHLAAGYEALMVAPRRDAAIVEDRGATFALKRRFLK
jgi:hypothetical protein